MRALFALLLLVGCASAPSEPTLSAPAVTLWPDCRFGERVSCEQLESNMTFGTRWTDGSYWWYRVFVQVAPVPSSSGSPSDVAGGLTSPCLDDADWEAGLIEVVDGVVETTGVAIGIPEEEGLDCPFLEAPYPLSITAHVEFDDGPALSLEWPLTFEYCYEDSSSETCDGQ